MLRIVIIFQNNILVRSGGEEGTGKVDHGAGAFCRFSLCLEYYVYT